MLSQDFVQKVDGNSQKLGIASQDCAKEGLLRREPLADKHPGTKAKLECAIKSLGLGPDLHPLQLGASTGAAKPEDVKQVLIGNGCFLPARIFLIMMRTCAFRWESFCCCWNCVPEANRRCAGDCCKASVRRP